MDLNLAHLLGSISFDVATNQHCAYCGANLPVVPSLVTGLELTRTTLLALLPTRTAPLAALPTNRMTLISLLAERPQVPVHLDLQAVLPDKAIPG